MEEPAETIVESRDELMISPTSSGFSDANPTLRTAHFLKPNTSSIDESIPKHPLDSPFSLPSNFESKNWPLKISFHGWRHPSGTWKEWVKKMGALHEPTWRKAGIFEAIMGSTYEIHRNIDLVLGVGEKWCPETNTFIFPWGEATVTLEDMAVSGYSVLGSPVLSPLETEDLKRIEQKLEQFRRLITKSKSKKASHSLWMTYFMETNCEFEHEAFLSLWLSRFVFPSNPIGVITQKVFPMAIHLATGTKISLAPPLLASIYRDLSLLKRKLLAVSKLGSCNSSNYDTDMFALTLWSPFQMVQVWVWERFPTLKPHSNVTEFGLPRLARWHNAKSLNARNLKLALDTAGSNFEWRPYAAADDNICSELYVDEEKWVTLNVGLNEEIESFARCLIPCKLVGIRCVELYHPHRVAMQFGMDQDIPLQVSSSNGTSSIAWESYDKLIMDAKVYVPSRHFRPDVTVRYAKWWKQTMPQKGSKVLQTSPNEEVKGHDLSPSPGSSSLKHLNTETGNSAEDSSGISNVKNGGCDDAFCPPGFTPKCQTSKLRISTKDINSIPNEVYRSKTETRSGSNGMKAVETPPSSTENEVYVLESWTKTARKRIKSEPLSSGKRMAMGDATSENNLNKPDHSVDVLKGDGWENGGSFSHEALVLQLEDRVRKLRKEVDKLKTVRFGRHYWSPKTVPARDRMS